MLGWGLPVAPIHQAAVDGGGMSIWPVIAFVGFVLGLGIGLWLLSIATPPDDTGRGPGRPPADRPNRPDPIGGNWVDDIERWLWEGAQGLGTPTPAGAPGGSLSPGASGGPA
jgi:hypothetical protein